jgi:hypothetical protein
MEVLPPGVKYGEKADGGAQQSRIGGGFKQRLSRGTEQETINLARVLKRHASDLRRQGEYDVEVRHGQKLGFALCEPARASLGLALGAVPVPARVI